MSTLAKILLAIGGIYAVNLLVKASAARSLNFSLANVSLNNVGFNVSLKATITIQNPSSSQYTIQSLVGNFFINDKMTGVVSSFQNTIVPPHSQVNYVVDISLQPTAVVSEIIALFNGPQNFVARMVGNADAEGLLIPFDITYTLI